MSIPTTSLAPLPFATTAPISSDMPNCRALSRSGAEGSEIVTPTLLVATRLELDLGGRRLALRAHGPTHTDNDLTILDDKTRTLWLSDLLFVDRLPVVDGSLLGWLAELDRLTTISADRAIPGHGPAAVS